MAGRIYGILFLARIHIANDPRTDVAEIDEPRCHVLASGHACLMLPSCDLVICHQVRGFEHLNWNEGSRKILKILN